MTRVDIIMIASVSLFADQLFPLPSNVTHGLPPTPVKGDRLVGMHRPVFLHDMQAGICVVLLSPERSGQ